MNTAISALLDNLTSHLIGSETAARLLVTGLLADGHVLIQGPPGMGKTSLAKTLAASVNCLFRRIQFTPDILPADIVGYSIFDQAAQQFRFHPGPIFGHIVLADEINRASPRTQSALLESMNEKQVSVDGVTYPLAPPFFVVATENHLSSAGTFPLPDSQLDRFLLSFEMPHPDPATQSQILAFHAHGDDRREAPPVMSREDILHLQSLARDVRVAPPLLDYIVRLAEAIRNRREFVAGVSSRAAIALMNAARASAFLDGRDAVYPDDIKRLMPFVFRHRLNLDNLDGRHGLRVENILQQILDSEEVPIIG